MSHKNREPTWRKYTRSQPTSQVINLIVNGIELNLGGNLQEIYAYYQMRERDHFLRQKIESQLENQKYVARGLEIKASQTLTFDNFQSIKVPADLSWSENPFGERSWQWSLHSLVMLRYLIAAYLQTQDSWFLANAEELVIDWTEDNLAPTAPSEFSWHDHATALRLENLLYLFECVRHREMRVPFLQTLLGLIYVHCNVLSEDSFYSKHTNHGLTQSYVLYWAGAVFSEFAEAKFWRAVGRERTKDEIGIGFSPEGVHVENSPGYHFTILGKAIQINELFRHYEEEPVDPEMDRLFNQALDFAAYVIKPDGTLPLVGDTQRVRPNAGGEFYRTLQSLPNYRHFLYSITQGAAGTAPPSVDRVFQKSGYAILRDQWHTKSEFEQSIYLLFKAGFLSTYHRHDDDLSFVLFGYGEDWLVDAGLYRHQSGDVMREYVRSNRAHNLVVIDELAMNRHRSESGSSYVSDHEIELCYSTVTGRHQLYRGFTTQRQVSICRPATILIRDRATPQDNQMHRYRILFHIPDDKEVTITGGRVVVRSTISAKTLTIQPIQGVFCDVYRVSGQEEPDYQGWISYRYGEVETATCVIFEAHETILDSSIELQFE